MKSLRFYKVNALPTTLVANALYFVKNGSEADLIITDEVGVPFPVDLDSSSGGSDANFVHTQLSASSLWTVNHNLVKKPSVTIVDSGDNVVVGDITYLNDNSLTIAFAAPFGGKAYCN